MTAKPQDFSPTAFIFWGLPQYARRSMRLSTATRILRKQKWPFCRKTLLGMRLTAAGRILRKGQYVNRKARRRRAYEQKDIEG